MATIDCSINVKQSNPPVLIVSGEVNYQSAPRIVGTFKRLYDEGSHEVALDCSAVNFIDSSGIGAIVHAAQAMRKSGGGIRLIAATAQLVHALQVSGFAGLLDMDQSVVAQPRDERKTANAGAWQQSTLSVPLTADMDGLVRKRVTELAETMPFTQEHIDDIKLAVGEAVSNAIRHGQPTEKNDRLTVRCMGDSEKIVVEIHNPGQPFDPDAVPIPNPNHLREGGMGIFFMRSTMDRVEYSFDETGTTVSLTKYIGARKAN